MSSINPYLHFKGQCAEAFKFYAACFNGKVEALFTHGESPMADQTPPEWRDKIMHGSIRVGDTILMGADAPGEYFEKPQGFATTLNVDSIAEAERIYNELKEGGTVKMALQETFWAVRFAMLVDRFGIPWMINHVKPCAEG